MKRLANDMLVLQEFTIKYLMLFKNQHAKVAEAYS